jgi:tetratricopeptide (TPR) repeat protein
MARKSRKPPHRPPSPRRATPPPDQGRDGTWWRETTVCGLLAAAVAIAYLPALSLPFLHFDDDIYVWKEPHVNTGLSAENWNWAWTHAHAANWHPLTTLSHMLDCQVFGLQPWGHHLVNLILHAVAAMLVFLVVRRMTDRFWPSATIAAIFAIHPLRVESVVWVAERKDLLCAVFFWLTVMTYVAYARRPFSPLRYALVMVALVLALLAKPMAVSLPFVLLVLDFWPLGRISDQRWATLLLEKLPLLALSTALCVKTLLVQREAVQLNQSLPISARALNALMSYQGYLVKTFWPASLAAHYPFPQHFSLAAAAVAAALLLAITLSAVALRRSRPYLLAGWLWYVGMLVPVIGLVQVGRQAMADRYTYLPQIGILMMIVFTAADFLVSRSWLRPIAATVICMLIAGLIVASWQQTRFWRGDYSFIQRALDCNEADSDMHSNMAAELAEKEEFAAALPHAQRALELDPDSASAHGNLANLLMAQGEPGAALPYAERCVELAPNHAEFRFLLGKALHLNKRDREAMEQFQEARRLRTGKAPVSPDLRSR